MTMWGTNFYGYPPPPVYPPPPYPTPPQSKSEMKEYLAFARAWANKDKEKGKKKEEEKKSIIIRNFSIVEVLLFLFILGPIIGPLWNKLQDTILKTLH
jgi:hypothetical protein